MLGACPPPPCASPLQVHGHVDAYVRRAALLAVGQVVASLPPARVAAALLASEAGRADAMTGSRGPDAADRGLLERLEWVQVGAVPRPLLRRCGLQLMQMTKC